MRNCRQILTFVLSLALFSCNSDSNTLVDEPQPSTDFFAFINAEVNGNQINTTIPSTGTVDYQATIGYLQHNNSMGNCENYNYRAGLEPISNSNLPSFNISFNKFLDEATQDCTTEIDDFETLFETNTYTYALTAQDYGVNVRYEFNDNGITKTYSSYGTQTGTSDFEITSFEIKDCTPKKCLNVLGTFSARLYNVVDASEFIDVTSGEFKVRVQSFNP